MACIFETKIEPGYYEDGKFGIRLENIELVVPAKTPYNYKDRGFLTFETVTLVPIQTSLLDVSLLTDKEVRIMFLCTFESVNVCRPF